MSSQPPRMSVKEIINNGDRIHIIGYIRVSTDDQAGGIETQKAVIRKKIEETESKYPEVNYHLVDFIVDEGVSGDSDPEYRDGFSELLTRITLSQGTGKPIKEVWVQNSDRIARNVDFLGHARVILKRLKCMLQDCSQEVQLPGEGQTKGVLLTRILDAMAEQELLKYREKAREGRERRVEEGKAITRPPLGYKVDQETEKIVVDEETKQIVKEIYDAYYHNGALPTQLANHYKLSRARVYYILRNRIYTTGEIRYGRHKQYTEPICPEFEKYQ